MCPPSLFCLSCSLVRSHSHSQRPDVLVPIMGGGMIPARVLRTFLKVPSEVDSSKKYVTLRLPHRRPHTVAATLSQPTHTSLHSPPLAPRSRRRNIPIQAIGLALYEEVAGTSAESMGREVIRTQWLDEGTFKRSHHHAKQPSPSGAGAAGGLLGKNILIVDEVDDTRTTLQYAYQELLADVQKGLAALDPAQRAALPPTRFAIFVVHNKHREGGKKGVLPLMAGQGEGWKLEDQKVGQDGVGEGVWYYSADETGDCWVDYPWETEGELARRRRGRMLYAVVTID